MVGVRADVVCLFLRMVVWQPFGGCWRLIIARVAEVHVAYHTQVDHEGCLFIGTYKNTSTSSLSPVY
jgi:hypothetical protein